ncbi:kinase-like protein [Aspergillus carlsbadensis]|nr:kinase-like protein [Aspergillus carlsbadensis]
MPPATDCEPLEPIPEHDVEDAARSPDGPGERAPIIPTVITYRHVHLGPEQDPPRPRYGEVIYPAKGRFLTRGGTGILELLPSGAVLKTPTPNPFDPREEEDHRRDLRLEAQVYQRLGGLHNASIPRLLDWDPETCCLMLEYLPNGNLRDYMRESQRAEEAITPGLRIRWAMGCGNFLLDAALNLKISDFGGVSLGGSVPSAFAATRYRRPGLKWDSPPQFEDDVFALGSLVYFIMTDKYPYEDVPSEEVEARYGRRDFPDVSRIRCGDIIRRCWDGEVDVAKVCEYFCRQLDP